MVATNAELGTNQLNAAAGKLKDYASKMKLPIQKFWPGEFLIRQGDPATEVFYIRTGECEVLLEEPNTDGDPNAPKSYVKLATVQAGEFVGERVRRGARAQWPYPPPAPLFRIINLPMFSRVELMRSSEH